MQRDEEEDWEEKIKIKMHTFAVKPSTIVAPNLDASKLQGWQLQKCRQKRLLELGKTPWIKVIEEEYRGD